MSVWDQTGANGSGARLRERIAGVGCEAVFEAVAAHKQLKLLDLYKCRTTEYGEGRMAECISENTSVEQVNQVIVKDKREVDLSSRLFRVTLYEASFLGDRLKTNATVRFARRLK